MAAWDANYHPFFAAAILGVQVDNKLVPYH